MSENQAIEVGQTWREPGDYGKFFNVQSVSPAWIKLTANYDGEEISVRRGTLREAWKFYPRLDDQIMTTQLEPIQLDDTPADNTSTHAVMQAAVAAFNAQTGLNLSEYHGWLLMLNIELVQTGDPTEIHGKDCFALYQESREVD